MQNIINIGDEIKNFQDITAPITSVVKGRYGLLIKDSDIPNLIAFVPWELPPIETIEREWYGWYTRSFIILPNGMRLGVVVWKRSDPRTDTIEEYDAEWERTMEAINEHS